MMRIAPSIASADQSNLAWAVQAADQAGADLIHFDIEDGVFIPNLTFGTKTVRQLRSFSDKPFDVHLQVQEPESYFDDVIAAGADVITFQVEATRFPYRAIYMLNQAGIDCGLALNAATQPDVITPILEQIQVVHLMTAEPDGAHADFIPGILDKIQQVRELIRPRAIEIEVDGGIQPSNAAQVAAAGATILVAGRAIWGASSVGAGVSALRAAGAK
jgi:ribulose-phosphate 3-epimerase